MSPTMAIAVVAVTVAVGLVNLVLVVGMTRQATRTHRALVALSRFVVRHVAGVVPREIEALIEDTYGRGNHRGR